MDKGADMSKIEPKTHPKKGPAKDSNKSVSGAGFYGKYPIHQLM